LRFKAQKGEFKVEFLTLLTGRNPVAGKRNEIRTLSIRRFRGDFSIQGDIQMVVSGF
jgi:hypothetical protein